MIDRSQCPAKRHGDWRAYVSRPGCRCKDARLSWGRYKNGAPYTPRRIDATGTRRMIQALMALGWSQRAMDRRLGFEKGAIYKLTKRAQVLQSTADRIARLYDELSMTVPGPSYASSRAKALAERRGWVPPLAWDDADIDNPAARPPRVQKVNRSLPRDYVDAQAVKMAIRGERSDRLLTPAELGLACNELEARGMSVRQIAARVGTSPRTVQRFRQARRAA